MLCDAGPLVAFVDRSQPDHARCRAAFEAATSPLVSTWPCFTEAMYLCWRLGGWGYQRRLWQINERRMIRLHTHADTEIIRMRALMDKYKDVPMDLADASLVAAADSLADRDVLTLDSDFRIYRTADGSAFNVFPT